MLTIAIVAYVFGTVLLMVAAPDLAAGTAYGPVQLGAVHLLGLAFVSVAIAGALMQLVPVILRTRVAPPWIAATSGIALIAGAWGLALGLWQGIPALTALGGSLAVLGGLVISVGVLLSVARAWRAGTLAPAGIGIAAATAWFIVVLALGGAMAGNRAHPFITMDLLRLIEVHGVIALAGWIGGSIMALSLNLAPMFSLAHGYSRTPGYAALIAWHGGTALVVAGLLWQVTSLALAGVVVMITGGALAVAFAVAVFRARRRRVEAPMTHLLVGLASALGAVLIVPAAWLGGGVTPRTLVLALVLGLVGLACGVTAGHLFKIVPMLVWTGRFASLAGTPGAPKLSDLYPHRLAVTEQVLFTAGLAVLLAGIGAGSPPVAVAGAAGVAASAVMVLVAAIACLAHPLPDQAATASHTPRQPPVTTWRNA